jgi:hypothetical protein
MELGYDDCGAGGAHAFVLYTDTDTIPRAVAAVAAPADGSRAE